MWVTVSERWSYSYGKQDIYVFLEGDNPQHEAAVALTAEMKSRINVQRQAQKECQDRGNEPAVRDTFSSSVNSESTSSTSISAIAGQYE